jgi:hypothetical protein
VPADPDLELGEVVEGEEGIVEAVAEGL